MVTGQSISGQWRQRQSSVRLEPAFDQPGAVLFGAYGRCESDSLVAAPSRPAGQWRRDGRSVHTILEYVDWSADAVCGYRFAGVQFGVVEAFVGIGVDARLLTESDFGVEISVVDAGGQIDRPFVSGAVFGIESGWRGYCHGCGR